MRASSSARSRKAENSGQYARGEGPRSERPCGQAAQVCATWPSTAASALASVCSFRLSRLSRRNRPRACRWGRQHTGAREGGLALICEGGRTRCAAAAPLARCAAAAVTSFVLPPLPAKRAPADRGRSVLRAGCSRALRPARQRRPPAARRLGLCRWKPGGAAASGETAGERTACSGEPLAAWPTVRAAGRHCRTRREGKAERWGLRAPLRGGPLADSFCSQVTSRVLESRAAARASPHSSAEAGSGGNGLEAPGERRRRLVMV